MDRQRIGLAEAMRRYRTGRLSRREALGLLAALGLPAATGLALVGRGTRGATAGGSGGHAGHGFTLLQEGSPPPEGPPPVATPVLGEQPDGTHVWRVQVGAFSEADLAEALAFLPEEITINAGDTIFFDNQGFHTVTFLSGGQIPVLGMPPTDLGTPMASPETGQPAIVLNPEVIFLAGGPNYDGTGYVNSGVPLDPTAPPFTLTFATPGTYDYLCLVHPRVMKGKVIVQEAGAARLHDLAAYDQMIQEQAAAILGQAQALVDRYGAATPAAAGGPTVHEVAAGVGEGQLEILRFLPENLSIKTGDTVRWTYRGIEDPHTVTFLGGGEPPEDLLIIPSEGGPPTLAINSATYDPAGGPVYSGQGYANSGYLWPDDPSDPRLPPDSTRRNTYELTFDTAGEHPYFCVLHGDPGARQGMVGTIVVS